MQYIVGTGAFSKAGKSCRLLTAFHKTGSAGNLMIGSYELGKTADKYISGDASFTWEEIKGDLFKVAMTGTSMWGSAKDFGTSYCFVSGTLVTTEDGQEPIEEIEVGDKVLSEDETTGEVAVKTVTETYINETDELIHIGVNGETISATPTHPFYVDKLGWTLARSLRAGDVLVLSNGELVTVEWVQHEILESPIKVYNFEVEDFHTYFVGENGIFVHNGCGKEEVSTNNISNESASKGKRWQVGDPIDAPTASGKNPKWSTVRQRYWKNEAYNNSGNYSASDLARMKKGKAPSVQYPENGQWYSMELHHKDTPQRDGGSNTLENLLPVSPWKHDEIDPYRHFKP